MARVLLDTSCIVALALTWHENHETTRGDLRARVDGGDEVVSAAPALVEAYSVLTRLPPAKRLGAREARDFLVANWGERVTVLLSAREFWRLLRGAPESGIAGGRIHDAEIASCAVKAGARILLTWNLAHFRQFESDDLSIEVPNRGA